MFDHLRAERPPALQSSKLQLMLRTPDGRRWGVTLSSGMERFIGPYSQVPGLGSDTALLDYQPLGCARSG